MSLETPSKTHLTSFHRTASAWCAVLAAFLGAGFAAQALRIDGFVEPSPNDGLYALALLVAACICACGSAFSLRSAYLLGALLFGLTLVSNYLHLL